MKTRVCTICREEKELGKYHKNKNLKDGHDYRCKRCRSEYGKKNRQRITKRANEWLSAHPEVRNAWFRKRRREHPETLKKERCRAKLRGKIRSGKIKKRDVCEICYDKPTNCHHDNYDKPFDFTELCRKCHDLLHQGI